MKYACDRCLENIIPVHEIPDTDRYVGAYSCTPLQVIYTLFYLYVPKIFGNGMRSGEAIASFM
ncbi:hypothetical protein [Desmonostoc muscorum]|uniref:hypothetical protein n=1 Tax=Desmonostoc muscorum TaxID=1179 RepID=UPI001F230ED8|nr:hypothetical protein [Desmonostoc muscorum]